MYLFHTTYVRVRKLLLSIDNYLYLQLAPSSAGISFMIQLFAIELAYSHSVLLRLFNGFITINPVFLFMIYEKCISLAI